MYTLPAIQELHATITQPMVEVHYGDRTVGYKTALAIEIPLIFIAVCTVVARVYSRLVIKRKLAPDDVLIMLGTAVALVRTVISCMSSEDSWGYDRKGPDRETEVSYYQHIFERRIAYLLAVTLTRFSILAYYLRIFPSNMGSLRKGCHVLMFLSMAHFVEVLTILIVSCADIGKLWTSDWLDFKGSQCFSSAVYSYSAAIGDTVVDSMIFTLPMPYVWQLSKIRVRQRISLIIVFGLGLIVCIVALLQIPFIKRREGSTTYFGSAVNMLIALQISLAIVAASLPDLRALVARNFPKFAPLHHRCIATAARLPLGGRRRAQALIADQEDPGAEHPRTDFGGRRVFRKPDWLRTNLPASLMSTRATNSEISDPSRVGSEDCVLQPPHPPPRLDTDAG